MASGVDELLNLLYTMIDEAKNAPFASDRCVIERDQALDLIDEIRTKFPVELSESKKIVKRQEDILANAQREAELIQKNAIARAQQLLAEDTIALQGRQRANEIMQEAEIRSRDLRRAANEYCEDTLRRTEEAVAAAYAEIKRSRSQFRATAGPFSQPQSNGGMARSMYDAASDDP